MTSRRQFITIVPIAGATLLGATRSASAADLPHLDEKDPQAVALGYVSDAARADKTKYPKYAPGQDCAACQLYQGKAGDAYGPCPLYAGKAVAAKGWCSAYVKKA
jgi:hypothetical protein